MLFVTSSIGYRGPILSGLFAGPEVGRCLSLASATTAYLPVDSNSYPADRKSSGCSAFFRLAGWFSPEVFASCPGSALFVISAIRCIEFSFGFAFGAGQISR